MKPVADSRFAVSIRRARESALACLLTYLHRVLRTIITRISLRNSPAIKNAGNIIRSPDLARVGARERRKRTEAIRSGTREGVCWFLLLPSHFRARIFRRSVAFCWENSSAISFSLLSLLSRVVKYNSYLRHPRRFVPAGNCGRVYISLRIAEYRLIADYGRTPSDLSFITVHPLLSRAHRHARSQGLHQAFFEGRSLRPSSLFSLSFPSSLLGLSQSLYFRCSTPFLSSLLLSPFSARPLRRRETARSSSGGKKYSAQCCVLRAEAAARFTCRFREIADSAKLRAARASNDEFSRRGESEIPVFSAAFVVNRPTGLPRVTKSMPDSKTVIGSSLLFSFFVREYWSFSL